MQLKYPRYVVINQLSYTAMPFAYAVFQRKRDCQRCTHLEVTVLSPWVFKMEDSNAVAAPTHREG